MAGELRSIKREAGPGNGSGGATRGGSKGSRSPAGLPGPGRATGEGPVPRASVGPGTGKTGSRSGRRSGRRRGDRPRAAGSRHRSRSTRGRRHPALGRGRAGPGPSGWPGRTTAITTNVPTSSRASEPYPKGSSQPFTTSHDREKVSSVSSGKSNDGDDFPIKDRRKKAARRALSRAGPLQPVATRAPRPD